MLSIRNYVWWTVLVVMMFHGVKEGCGDQLFSLAERKMLASVDYNIPFGVLQWERTLGDSDTAILEPVQIKIPEVSFVIRSARYLMPTAATTEDNLPAIEVTIDKWQAMTPGVCVKVTASAIRAAANEVREGERLSRDSRHIIFETHVYGDGRVASLGSIFSSHEIYLTFEIWVVDAAYPLTPRSVNNDLLDTLMGGFFTDATLEMGTVNVSVHKVILAARSRTFREMLTGDPDMHSIRMEENVSEGLLRGFVQFLYSGVVMAPSNDIVDLFALGERYRVDTLMQTCETILIQQLNAHSDVKLLLHVIETPSLSKNVRRRAIAVVVENWESISSSDVWRSFSASPSTSVLADIIGVAVENKFSGDTCVPRAPLPFWASASTTLHNLVRMYKTIDE